MDRSNFRGNWKLDDREKVNLLKLVDVPTRKKKAFLKNIEGAISTYIWLRDPGPALSMMKRIVTMRKAAGALMAALPKATEPTASNLSSINHFLSMHSDTPEVHKYQAKLGRLRELVEYFQDAAREAEHSLRRKRGRPTNRNARFFTGHVLKSYLLATGIYPKLSRTSPAYQLLLHCLHLSRHELSDPFSYYRYVIVDWGIEEVD